MPSARRAREGVHLSAVATSGPQSHEDDPRRIWQTQRRRRRRKRTSDCDDIGQTASPSLDDSLLEWFQ